ncbi:OmpP1/FadL family transporter [Parendozoicomonas haliclonae]|uniref:Long-chain fatty acid transport protein n=1 Tax=Parendozoicomonas haliclonae TaxID=1960125 RepID=A0A1X7AJV6_9GAMM|nr:outer membrane protein transport protein [Parendozoicomonas haliclonae]SMA47259.1 Long-chain fatty acid transport protein precursor [Parendozoicomonas haliclonae]
MSRNGTIKLFSLTALCAAMLPTMQASAAGFQVNEHSAAGLGRAFAGEAAIAEDASVLARNVAAMSFVKGPMFTGAVSYVKPEVEIEAKNALGQTSTDKAVANEAMVPVFYYVRPVDDKLSFGVGGFTNYGFTTNYKDNSVVTMSGNYSEVISYNFNASVAYKLQENLSVGFGANAVRAEGRLQSSMGSNDALDVEGDDWGYGWNAGIFWEPVSGTRVGASYRSEVEIVLDGKAHTDLAGLGAPFSYWNSTGSVDLTLPAITEISVWQQVNERLAVHASYMKTHWSSFEEIQIDVDKAPAAAQPPAHVQDYNDASRWSVGATYLYNADLSLRAGYAYDNSPAGNDRRSFRIPDTDRQWFTLGAGYKLDNQQSIDFGYAFIKAKKAEIHDAKYGLSGEIKKGDAHILSVQYNYSF